MTRPISHPEDLLAAYTDGSLDDPERARVQAHLDSCATCRGEVELARGAVRSLATLPDEPVPPGVMNPVVAELGRQMRRAPGRPWYVRLQWAAGLAAAAVLVVAVAVTLPRLGGGVSGGGGGAVGASERAAASPTAPGGQDDSSSRQKVPLEDQTNVDYDAAKLQALAQSVAAFAVGGQPTLGEPSAARDLIPALAAKAEACVTKASEPSSSDRLVRLIQARYEGTPAYLGVYLVGPGASQPPTKVTIWAVARSDCHILSFTSQRL